jgi:peptidoglycan/LPS O-acetylase OafA/YrhL
VVSWLGSSADPFQPIVIPFNIGAIACIYLIGVALVHRRRSKRTRAAVQSGSDNSYGIYLAQVLFITILSWIGWRHLNVFLPWPLVSVITVAIVFLSCIALTELLARTPLAKPLTGRTRVPWHRASTRAAVDASRVTEAETHTTSGQPRAPALSGEPATAAAMAEAIAR